MLLWLMLAIVVTGFLIEGDAHRRNELVGGDVRGPRRRLPGRPRHRPHRAARSSRTRTGRPGRRSATPSPSSSTASASAPATMLDVHKVLWWTHLPMALLWTAWVGYGKISPHHPRLRQHLHAQPRSPKGADRRLRPGADQGLRDGRVVRRRPARRTSPGSSSWTSTSACAAAAARSNCPATHHRQRADADGLPQGHQALPGRGRACRSSTPDASGNVEPLDGRAPDRRRRRLASTRSGTASPAAPARRSAR